ncbi:MAG: alpha-L-fucosidase [Clostridia bacterium]|nr:alpha-L-fucosidase [Clostridia bacterium]
MNIFEENNWTTTNNHFPLNDSEVQRYISVLPDSRQLIHSSKPFYLFMHFGMNTATGREWGAATETVEDFTITNIDPKQWVHAAAASGATGIILTCKHHDGFCLWDTKTTDFNVMNTALGIDVVKALSDECRKRNIDFGVYLSPWDMHEPCYATPQYNDFFCNQLTELLTNYGNVFEVWFDGAKGKEAKAFAYDWERYYQIVRELQPDACISICGPDLRWVGNEAGKCRHSEFSVVPEYLTKAETVQKYSQHTREQAELLQKITSKDEDLGSRSVLEKHPALKWYPAEVDVSIRKGWFHPGGGEVKSAEQLFDIYLKSVGNNCALLLNVPPNKDGLIDDEDFQNLAMLGARILSVTSHPVAVFSPGRLTEKDGVLRFDFSSDKQISYCVIAEDISAGQRVEKFDLYLIDANGDYSFAFGGTVIGSGKIISVNQKAKQAILIIRQSRSIPCIKSIGFFE